MQCPMLWQSRDIVYANYGCCSTLPRMIKYVVCKNPFGLNIKYNFNIVYR